MHVRSVHFGNWRRGRAPRLDLHLLQPDLVRPLLAALLAGLGTGALAVLELEQEHQRAVVVDHLLADLLAPEEIRPRPGLAGPQFQVIGILPVALLDDRGEVPGELRILDPPAPRRALVDADAGRRLAERGAAARLVEIAHAQTPAALRRQ